MVRLTVEKSKLVSRWLAVGVLFAALIIPQVATAATPSTVTLSSDSQVSYWSGTVTSGGPRRPEVPECTNVSCDKFKLNISLPGSVLAKSGGVQVAIRFINGTPDDNLQLAVYNQNNQRVASSTAAVGTAQGVLLRFSPNLRGAYWVYVVDGIAYGDSAPSPSISYEGVTRVQYDPAAQPARQLLPDLQALPQTNVTFGPPFEIFDDPVPAGSTCHQSEIDEGAQVCLRFDQNFANRGEGAVDIRFDVPVGLNPVDGQTIPVVQRIYNSTGGYSDRAAGNVVWHAIHHHWHFQNFAQSNLWATDSNGNRTGSTPVASGNKNGFCLATTNIDPNYWGQPGLGSDDYPAPDCLQPYATSGGYNYFKMGLATGWSDEYNWFLPDQYVEVSNVPNGDYILDTTVDPTRRLTQSNTTNDCGSVRVRLSNMGTANPQAALLGTGPACGY